MFESLSDKLTAVFGKLTGKGRISENDVDEALRAVRLALLEADVDFKVVSGFIKAVRGRAIGSDIFTSLTPGQTVVKIVREELAKILGGEAADLQRGDRPPTVIMLVGLHGAGKTTTAAKLALHIRKTRKQDVMLVAADLKRPAAIDQLVQLGKQLNIPVYSESPDGTTPPKLIDRAIKQAQEKNVYWLILDTAGRLHIDDELMAELAEIRDAVKPVETLLVVDAMTGQDAVRSGSEFHNRVGLTGIIMTKMEGDARGGAALSMRSVTGVPIKFIGVGEKPDALEPYHPDRLASRILGMGDVVTLIEKAQEDLDLEKAKELEKRLKKAQFNLEDFLDQIRQVRKMGPISDLLGMIPGMGALRGKIDPRNIDEKRLVRAEAIVLSMTLAERRDPRIINGSRRRRIAIGSGTSPSEVNQLLNQFFEMQKLMKRVVTGGGRRALMGMLAGKR
ncbi:MAG: signal recognition particle protein [Chloroflexi bacterium]|nr:signal recognition particle protein [Chloroflexota bacterium]